MNCTRCEGSGFLNLDQIGDVDLKAMENSGDFHAAVLKWIDDRDVETSRLEGCTCFIAPPCSYCMSLHDVAVCDCCGDGQGWYGTPGEHNYRKGGDEPVPGCG